MVKQIIVQGQKLYDSDYIVDRCIGQGGMNSIVYLVHLPKHPEKKFSAKVIFKGEQLTEDFWRKFGDEAVTSLRVLRKQNIVSTYEVIKDHNRELIILVQDYIEGISLREYLTKNGCIVPKMALTLFQKILKGVQSLHNFQQTIVHRDLKPENILLSKDLSKVTIIDFGISTVIERTEQYLKEYKIKCYTDERGDPQGTPYYLIPDVLRKDIGDKINYKTLDVQADFYSLGVILYEMIIGKKPFDTDGLDLNIDANKAKIVRMPTYFDIENISANPHIPVAIENIIFRCMACKRDDLKYRYEKIEEIISDVDETMRILNKEIPDTKLLKSVSDRIFQKHKMFKIQIEKTSVPFYKQTWFFVLVAVLCFVVLIVSLLLFFFL